MTFAEYAQSKGITLNKDDLAFIKSRIGVLPYAQRIVITRRYIEVWLSHMVQCENAVKRNNEGRKAANIWIRTVT